MEHNYSLSATNKQNKTIESVADLMVNQEVVITETGQNELSEEPKIVSVSDETWAQLNSSKRSSQKKWKKPALPFEELLRVLQEHRSQLVNTEGKQLPLKSKIYSTISALLNNKISPLSIYVFIKQNRKGICDLLGIEYKPPVYRDSDEDELEGHDEPTFPIPLETRMKVKKIGGKKRSVPIGVLLPLLQEHRHELITGDGHQVAIQNSIYSTLSELLGNKMNAATIYFYIKLNRHGLRDSLEIKSEEVIDPNDDPDDLNPVPVFDREERKSKRKINQSDVDRHFDIPLEVLIQLKLIPRPSSKKRNKLVLPRNWRDIISKMVKEHLDEPVVLKCSRYCFKSSKIVIYATCGICDEKRRIEITTESGDQILTLMGKCDPDKDHSNHEMREKPAVPFEELLRVLKEHRSQLMTTEGKQLTLKSEIYSTISALLDNKMSPLHIYVFIKQNRKGISDLLGIKYEPPVYRDSDEDEPEGHVVNTFPIPLETWMVLKPVVNPEHRSRKAALPYNWMYLMDDMIHRHLYVTCQLRYRKQAVNTKYLSVNTFCTVCKEKGRLEINLLGDPICTWWGRYGLDINHGTPKTNIGEVVDANTMAVDNGEYLDDVSYTNEEPANKLKKTENFETLYPQPMTIAQNITKEYHTASCNRIISNLPSGLNKDHTFLIPMDIWERLKPTYHPEKKKCPYVFPQYWCFRLHDLMKKFLEMPCRMKFYGYDTSHNDTNMVIFGRCDVCEGNGKIMITLSGNPMFTWTGQFDSNIDHKKSICTSNKRNISHTENNMSTSIDESQLAVNTIMDPVLESTDNTITLSNAYEYDYLVEVIEQPTETLMKPKDFIKQKPRRKKVQQKGKSDIGEVLDAVNISPVIDTVVEGADSINLTNTCEYDNLAQIIKKPKPTQKSTRKKQTEKQKPYTRKKVEQKGKSKDGEVLDAVNKLAESLLKDKEEDDWISTFGNLMKSMIVERIRSATTISEQIRLKRDIDDAVTACIIKK